MPSYLVGAIIIVKHPPGIKYTFAKVNNSNSAIYSNANATVLFHVAEEQLWGSWCKIGSRADFTPNYKIVPPQRKAHAEIQQCS